MKYRLIKELPSYAIGTEFEDGLIGFPAQNLALMGFAIPLPRSTEEFSEYANNKLFPLTSDPESYHAEYDNLLEERLEEIEPGLLELMWYDPMVSRWYS